MLFTRKHSKNYRTFQRSLNNHLVTKETSNSNSGSPGIRNDYNIDADDSNSSEDTSDIDQIIAYQDRTSRRGRGNRFENILLRLKYP